MGDKIRKPEERIELGGTRDDGDPFLVYYRLSLIKNLGKEISRHRTHRMKENLKRIVENIIGHHDAVIRIQQDEQGDYIAKVYTKD